VGGRKGRKQSTTFASRQLAEAANALCLSRSHRVTDEEVYRAIHGVAEDETGIPTVAEWADTWIDARRRVDDVQEDTVTHQASVIRRRIIPKLGKLRLSPEQMTPEVIAEWVQWLRSQPSAHGGALSPWTVRKTHAILHGLLAAAVPRYLPANPAGARAPGSSRRKSGLPKAEQYEAIFLDPDEINIMKAACGPAIRPMVIVALGTGLRLGELLVLRVEDVQLTGRRKVIRVRRALKNGGKIGPPKSRNSRRDVTISAAIVKVLTPLVQDRPRHVLVFTAPQGGRWNPSNLRQRYWLPALAEAQRCAEHPPPLPPKPQRGPRRRWRLDEVSTCDCSTRLHRAPRWHDLRHTHVSICVEEGWDAIKVSRRVGHDSYKTTMDIYGHLWEGGAEDAVAGLDKYLLMSGDEDA
jgi:integrase